MTDTIFALASARGKAGVSVIRVSGPQAHAAGRALCGSLPEVRQAGVRRLRSRDGEPLDDALVLCFAAGSSFTGEDIVEFQLHGGAAVISAVLNELSAFQGLRPAEAGEFTRRALVNDRLDLAQIEGLGALIDAETEAQRRQAFRVFDGALSDLVEDLRSDVIRAAALVEASIDFVDEDAPVDVVPEVAERIAAVLGKLETEISGVVIAERIRDGFEVAIVGVPNVGKSTLLNRLVGRDAAITSEVAGTTRDVIEVRMDVRGLPVTFLDTAGLRQTEDLVESIGVDRARARAARADLRIFLTEDGVVPEADLRETDDLVVRAKADLLGGEGVSGVTGQGIDALLDRIAGVLEHRAESAATATHARHRHAMIQAQRALQEAADAVTAEPIAGEIVAEHLRSAARALESLIGRVDVEGLLDEIFRSFCIGK